MTLAKEHSNIIPPITDPLGRAWDQPSLDRMFITDKYATMGKLAFEELLDYSNSQPTGCYPGKCWKLMDGKGKWFLAWFGIHEDPKFCTNNYREIIISENL